MHSFLEFDKKITFKKFNFYKTKTFFDNLITENSFVKRKIFWVKSRTRRVTLRKFSRKKISMVTNGNNRKVSFISLMRRRVSFFRFSFD